MSSRMSWHRLVAALTLVAALLSPVLLIGTWLPVADDLDVPHWDQWEMVPLLDAATAGTLSAADLFRQDGETRPLVPRVVLVALALATGWDTRAEVLLNLAVGACPRGWSASSEPSCSHRGTFPLMLTTPSCASACAW